MLFFYIVIVLNSYVSDAKVGAWYIPEKQNRIQYIYEAIGFLYVCPLQKEKRLAVEGRLRAVFLMCCCALCGIMQIFFRHIRKHFFQIFACFVACHWQILQKVVAAISCGGTGNLAFVCGDESECFA